LEIAFLELPSGDHIKVTYNALGVQVEEMMISGTEVCEGK